jgi:hypothetical protein
VGRARLISNMIYGHDNKLFCEKNREGKLCIYRKGHRVEYYELEGDHVGFVRPAPHFILALTHNWLESGYSVEWGLLPIMARLRAMDLWSRDIATESMKETEKANLSKERDLSNKNESFLKEFRRPFAKAFEGVNTANMDKTKDSRRKQDERIK